jgi:magnesium transporter
MKPQKSRSSSKVGLPPGTLVHIGNKHLQPSDISLIHYTSDTLSYEQDVSLKKCATALDESNYSWANFNGVEHINEVGRICNAFDIHTLWQEDIVNTHHRPKFEFYKDQVYITFKMIHPMNNSFEIVHEQVSMVFSKYWLISFQERKGDVFEGLRDRMGNPEANMRKHGVDYLAYRILDTIVDNYFLSTEFLQDQITILEDEIWERHQKEQLIRIQTLKKQAVLLRKLILPLREAILNISKEYPAIIQENTFRYLKDVSDNIIHIIDSIDQQKEQLNSLMDAYNTAGSNRMNEVMQMLTIVSTIFIPLTFVAGIYGMNFAKMPELNWEYGYPTVWGIMVCIAIAMILYFKKRKWI